MGPAIKYQFQPALPLRGVTSTDDKIKRRYVFQPALPLRGVTSVGTSRVVW